LILLNFLSSLFFSLCCSPIFVVVDVYSWELTFCKINYIGSRVCSDAYVLPLATFLGLSFLPMRSPSSFSVILVPYGPTTLVFPLSSFSSKVSSSRKNGLKVHTQMMAWVFPFEISCACITFYFSHTFCKSFQYLFGQYPTLHPTIDLHFFLPLTMPWISPQAKYSASWIHYFF
jgi:hypothetical protein